MPTYEDAIGMALPSSTLPVERGKIREFATALLDDSPIYRNREAAQAAGFPDTPVPVTFPICAHLYSDTGGAAIMHLIEQGIVERGFVLHGEQEFIYHRPVYAEEKFTVQQKVVDAYQKEGGKGSMMTFFVVESALVDAHGETACAARTIVLERKPVGK